MGCSSSTAAGFKNVVSASSSTAEDVEKPDCSAAAPTYYAPRSGRTSESIRDAGSGHTTVEDLEAELEELPAEVRHSFTDLQAFQVEELQTICPRPLSLLAFAAVRDAASAIAPASDAYSHLPSLLGVLSRSVRREGSYSQLHKLQVVQFLFHNIQPGGALHDLSLRRPLSIVAVLLSSLTYDCDTLLAVRKSVDVRRSMGGRRSFELRRPQRSIDIGSLPAGRTMAGSSSRASALGVGRITTQAHNLSVQKVLSVTRFFQALPEKERTQLLFTVAELNTVRSPGTLAQMLQHAPALLFQDPDLFLLKSTLVVASFSHLLRKFKLHQDWCQHTLLKRRATLFSQNFDTVDSSATQGGFQRGSHTSERFAKCQSWVIDHMLIPFANVWARTAQVKSADSVCFALCRASDTYKMRFGAVGDEVDGDLFTTASSLLPLTRSAFSAKTGTGTYSSAISLEKRLVCPVTHPDDVKLPADQAGILSVCKMYNITAEVLYPSTEASKEARSDMPVNKAAPFITCGSDFTAAPPRRCSAV